MTHPPLKSSKGVSASGVRLLNRAMSAGYVPSPTSCGPAKFLRMRRDAKNKPTS